MLLVGLLLIVIGYFLVVPVLETIGIILAIIGGVLMVTGYAGHPIGGRRYWW